MPNRRKLGRFELQRLSKDTRWARKWVRIESKYRKPVKEYETETIKEPVKIETVSPPLTESMVEQPSTGIPEEPEMPAPPEEQIKEPESLLTGLLENPFFEISSEFIFKLPNGNEVGRAKDVNEFYEFIRRGPLDSILYHANEEHFSPWLKYKGYKKLAKKIRNIKGNTKRTRKRLLRLIARNS